MPTETGIMPKPAPVPRCGKPGHRSNKGPGCDDCKRYSAYCGRLQRWERKNGINNSMADGFLVADHLHDLVENGNWRLVDIATASGVSRLSVGEIYERRREVVMPITAASLLALKPREECPPFMINLVPAVETLRILRGLFAQGWTFRHMSLTLGFSDTWAFKLAGANEWVYQDSLLLARRLAEQLGPYDVANLPRPLPGMSVRTAKIGNRKGWVPLSAWYGQDMADPAATPWKIRPTGTSLVAPLARPAVAAEQEDDLPELSPWAYIDPILTLRVAEAADVVRRTNKENGRRPEGYITPIKHLTRAEAYVLVDIAAKAGISATLTGLMLGYRLDTKSELSNTQRAVERMKATFKEGRTMLDRLIAGEKVDPGWCFQCETGNGVNDFAAVLAAILAVQDAPFGPGWSPAELADRAGVGESAMRVFLAYATRRADASYEVKHITRRQPVTGCTELTDLVVPVDLGAVLAA